MVGCDLCQSGAGDPDGYHLEVGAVKNVVNPSEGISAEIGLLRAVHLHFHLGVTEFAQKSLMDRRSGKGVEVAADDHGLTALFMLKPFRAKHGLRLG